MALSENNLPLDRVRSILLQLTEAVEGLPAPYREVLLSDCRRMQADTETMVSTITQPEEPLAHPDPLLKRQPSPVIRMEAGEKAEQQFSLKAKNYFDQILEAANEIIWIVDANARTAYINPQGAAALGYTVAEMQGRTPGEMMFQEDIAASYLDYQQRDSLHNEYRLRRKDGSEIWLLSATTPLYDEAQKFIGALCIASDVTSRRKAEQALHTSEERFRIALANAPITVYTMNRDLRYTWIYHPPVELAEEQYLGRRDDEIITAKEIEPVVRLKRSVIEEGKAVHQEVRFDTQEGEVFFYLTLEPLRNSTGEVIGIIGATIDLTEQRRLEYQQKEYTARMELHYRLVNQREKELARIASTIYDGPLQDLSSIAFAVQVAKEMAQDTEVIDIIDEIKVRAQKLVDDLRSVCREIHPPSITRFGLKRAIEAHANEYQKRHPDIHVHMLLMEDYIRIPNNICLALFRIYQESLQNVALHTQATSVSILLSLEPEQFRLVIEDNGKGFLVPPDLMALVKHDHFGIVSMREYAEAVHGSLEIQSEPGIGTKVSAIIPAEEPSADFDSE